MVVIEAFFALIVALVTGPIVFILRRAHGRPDLFFLLTLFLLTWAGGAWLTPLGPSFRGVFWLPYVLSSLIAALVMIAFPPPWERGGRVGAEGEGERAAAETEASVVRTLLWVLIALVGLAMLLGRSVG